jgi:hypothetical protein
VSTIPQTGYGFDGVVFLVRHLHCIVVHRVLEVYQFLDTAGASHGSGRSGPNKHPGVKSDRRNVRASHGLAGMMQSFKKRISSVEPALLFCCQQIRFLSADSVRGFLSSADSLFVSRFRLQIYLLSRFTFCQQILSADFYGQQFWFLSEECLMFRRMAICL